MHGADDLDFGVPTGSCKEISPGVFNREWSKINVTLDCNSGETGWEAEFTQQL
jgi:hypothetical protein